MGTKIWRSSSYLHTPARQGVNVDGGEIHGITKQECRRTPATARQGSNNLCHRRAAMPSLQQPLPRSSEVGVPLARIVDIIIMPGRIILLHMEVPQVFAALDRRHVGGAERVVVQCLPIEVAQFVPGVDFDVPNASSSARKPLTGLLSQELSHKLFSGPIAAGRELYLVDALHHLGIGLHRLRGLEGRVAREELIQQNTQRPPIKGSGVARSCDQLWSEVVRCAARRKGLADDEPS
mmetsp:Transcript_46392/g.117806  ORF Transcript_46392/g.117806 Transcript_46392/m.117806 type:complete len:236 (-) Transcript_46392:286-993(-)